MLSIGNIFNVSLTLYHIVRNNDCLTDGGWCIGWRWVLGMMVDCSHLACIFGVHVLIRWFDPGILHRPGWLLRLPCARWSSLRRAQLALLRGHPFVLVQRPPLRHPAISSLVCRAVASLPCPLATCIVLCLSLYATGARELSRPVALTALRILPWLGRSWLWEKASLYNRPGGMSICARVSVRIIGKLGIVEKFATPID